MLSLYFHCLYSFVWLNNWVNCWYQTTPHYGLCQQSIYYSKTIAGPKAVDVVMKMITEPNTKHQTLNGYGEVTANFMEIDSISSNCMHGLSQ